MLKVVMGVVMAFALSGCCWVWTGPKGGICNGHKQEVTFQAENGGRIDVYSNDELLGATPFCATISRHTTAVKLKEGEKIEHYALPRSVQWFPLLLDIFVWPTFFVDFGTGAAWSYPDVIVLE